MRCLQPHCLDAEAGRGGDVLQQFRVGYLTKHKKMTPPTAKACLL